MLPFTVKFTKKIRDLKLKDNLSIIICINEFLDEREANVKEKTETKLTFKGSKASFTTNWNIFYSVDKGTFSIEEKNGVEILTYEIVLHKLFFFSIIFSIIGALVVQMVWVGFVGFLFLGVLNWIISTLRNKDMFDDIIEEIKHSEVEKMDKKSCL